MADILSKLQEGDEIWVNIGDKWWAKRVKQITLQPDGSYTLSLEEALEVEDGD